MRWNRCYRIPVKFICHYNNYFEENNKICDELILNEEPDVYGCWNYKDEYIFITVLLPKSRCVNIRMFEADINDMQELWLFLSDIYKKKGEIDFMFVEATPKHIEQFKKMGFTEEIYDPGHVPIWGESKTTFLFRNFSNPEMKVNQLDAADMIEEWKGFQREWVKEIIPTFLH